LNLSRTASLGTEETDCCGEVAFTVLYNIYITVRDCILFHI